ncbi:hypothetical protein SD70_20075 [Gordoniibacillus kamchatkensis]|uniref:Major facilitator superfamily (MFS) profile domain-containing protein n=2 Tax=Gordoniibacillus kamchatkensis TaxID=1590651 RepID=A0ABR5AEH6_9BACL|nr:hypothetical protein SD70_20075 [Paenibacillus sp. VKM B-2647]
MDALAADEAVRGPASKVSVMASYTVSFDLGAALGPLAAYAVLSYMPVGGLYFAVGALLALLAAGWAIPAAKTKWHVR